MTSSSPADRRWPDCDGRCSLAAGTKAELGNLTRFLTYHQQHGYRADARRQYAEMTDEARDWSVLTSKPHESPAPVDSTSPSSFRTWNGTWLERRQR